MEILLIKRVMPLNGREDISLVPAFQNDWKVVNKMESGTYLPCDVLEKRSAKTNRGNWALIRFFVENMPEYIENQLGKKRAENVAFIREWLKMEIGFTDVFEVDGIRHIIPRKSDRKSLPDEQEFIRDCKTPMEKKVSELMGFDTVYEMIKASIEWSKEVGEGRATLPPPKEKLKQ